MAPTSRNRRRGRREFSDLTPAEQRAGRRLDTAFDGRVDAMSRRSDRDPLVGHFCLVLHDNAEARAALAAAIGEENVRPGEATYAVLDRPLELDTEGWPVTALVVTRDEHAANV